VCIFLVVITYVYHNARLKKCNISMGLKRNKMAGHGLDLSGST